LGEFSFKRKNIITYRDYNFELYLENNLASSRTATTPLPLESDPLARL